MMRDLPDTPDAGDDAPKSRSQKKRESTAAQQKGEALAALSKEELEKRGVPDNLIQAIAAWKKFPSREAKRRQMQYIGRLMREMEEAATLRAEHE